MSFSIPFARTPRTPGSHARPLVVLASLLSAIASGCGGPAVPTDGGHTGLTLGFTPSNADLSGLDLSTIGDVDFVGTDCGIQSEQSGLSCADASLAAFRIVTQPNGIRVGVYVARSFRIEPNAVVTVSGTLPVILIALDRIDVLGTLVVASDGDAPSAGGYGQDQSYMMGGGAGGGGAGSTMTAGGGGSSCGIGGAGAAESGAGAPGGAVGGNARIVPLVGGSSGGAAAGGGAGAGGGAIQLVAGNVVNVAAGGVINAGGGGGDPGGSNEQEATGGGSGGAILIEAPMVTVSGTLAANGGGGGQGARGSHGDNAHASVQPALGGSDPTVGSIGGTGSAASATGGTAGMVSDGVSAGAGGGGAGWIRINTHGGQATLAGATLSPAAATTCVTQGTLAP